MLRNLGSILPAVGSSSQLERELACSDIGRKEGARLAVVRLVRVLRFRSRFGC